MRRNNENFTYAVSRFFKFYLPGECGFKENTILSYRDTFKQLLLYCKQERGIDPDKLELTDFSRNLINGFLTEIEANGKSVSTRNQRLSAIKSFFKYVEFAFPDYLDVAREVRGIRIKKQPQPSVGYLTVEGIAALLQQPDTSVRSGYRDMLMLTVLYDSGARVSEITKIRIGDIRIQTPATIILHGKDEKDRPVPLSSKTVALIGNYLRCEQLDAPENKDKLLFTNRQGSQLTRTGVTYVLKKYADLVRERHPGIIPDVLSAHCIRHSKAMHLLQANVPLIYIRDFLGHTKISTTEIYARADSESKRKALESAYSPVVNVNDSEASWHSDSSLMSFLEALSKR